MIKAKLHEVTGMPAGKQKLQLGVSTVIVISIQSLHTVSLTMSVFLFGRIWFLIHGGVLDIVSNSIFIQFIAKRLK